MFEVSHKPLDVTPVLAAVAHPTAGGVDVFLGVVRDHSEGRAVTRLDYEAYEPMAVAEMKRIAAEIAQANPGVRLAAVHRVGELAVGDLAVICAASAPHRGEAFAACRRLIDEIKARLPVWKREWGPDGPYWVGWEDARCNHDGAPAAGPNAHARSHATEHAHAHSHSHSHATEHAHAHGSAHTNAHGAERANARSDSPPGGRVAAHHADAPGSAGAAQAASHEADSAEARARVRVMTLTISDTRTPATDRGGEVLRGALAAAGYALGRHAIVPDEPARVRAEITGAIERGEVEAVVSTGGTGIAPRDRTCEAVEAILEKKLEGFGEAFRRLSWEQVGARSMLSRAVAGTYRGAVIAALPGSPRAVALGVESVLAPVLWHAVALAKG